MSDKVHKSDEQWRAELTPEQYQVCRRKGTERAFTGEYHATKAPGTYHCACCGAPLFTSAEKFCACALARLELRNRLARILYFMLPSGELQIGESVPASLLNPSRPRYWPLGQCSKAEASRACGG